MQTVELKATLTMLNDLKIVELNWQKNLPEKRRRERKNKLKNFFKIIFLTLLLFNAYQTSSIAVEKKKIEKKEERQKKIDTLNWYNWDNPREHSVLLEDSNAEIFIIENEYYLKGNKDINQYSWWVWGNEKLEDVLMIFGSNYTVYVKYIDEGYVTIDDWKSQDTDAWINQMRAIQKSWLEDLKKKNLDYVENLNWINKPEFNEEKKHINYSYEILWNGKDGKFKSLESTSLVLGRKGYLDISFVTKIKPDTDLKSLANISKEFADGVKYNEGSSYEDYKSGDKIAALGIGGLVAGTLGVKALAKVGVFAKLLPLLLKFGWILLIPLVFVGKLFGKKNQPRSSSKRKK